MDIRLLRYFLAVVDAGSVSGAARTLHVAQPSLSVALRRLESELGADLVIRTSQGAVPTPVGRHLADMTRRILEDVDTAAAQVRSMAAGKAGRLSLAVTPTYAWAHLAEVLGLLAAEAPDVQIALRDPPPLEIIDLVTVGGADVGIVATHDPDELEWRYGRDLDMVRGGTMPVIAALPPHWAGSPGPIALDSLRDEAWVVPLQSRGFPGMAALTERLWRQRGWSPPVVREVSTSQTGLPIISGGLGVTLMPDSVRRIADGTIVLRDLSDEIPPLTVVSLTRRGYPTAPAVAMFLRAVREVSEA